MLIRLSVIIGFICSGTNVVFAQELKYSILGLSSESKLNANLVVRSESIEIEIRDINSLVVTTKRVTTLLNDNADRYATIYEFYDKTRKIKKQELLVYDKFGQEIAKFKNSDFQDVSAISSNDLYTDNRLKYIEYTPTEYPVTLVYQSEVATSETAFIEPWTPLPVPYISVEESSYLVRNLAKIPIRFKEFNLEDYDVTTNHTEFDLNYTMSNAPALVREVMIPEFRSITPEVKVALNSFSLVNVQGFASDWKDFGAWQYNYLIKGLDELPPTTINEVNSLVAGITDKKEITRRVYNFVQNKTRYISVQLGIGGWKPYPAEQVDDLGYGDCKGLTNYTKALLKTQGIEANYTVVYAGAEQRDIDSEFASMQGNHVILNVPLENEDIWLECTSQTMPFNFLGSFTDDRNVLLITPQGGEIVRTPAYINEANLQSSKGSYELLENGDIKGEVIINSNGISYDQKYRLKSKNTKEVQEHYLDLWGELKNVNLKKVVFKDDKESVNFTEDVQIEAQSYATTLNDKFIFKPNVFNINNYVPRKSKNRRYNFIISRGYKEVDSFNFKVPSNMTADYLPDEVTLNTKYGSYHLKVEDNGDGSFTYLRELSINKGDYQPDEYENYRAFRKSVKKHDNTKVVFKKTP